MTCYNKSMSFFPSQKFIIILLLIVVTGSGTYAYTLYKNHIKNTETTEIFNEAKGSINVVFNTENILSQDTDRDGIPDVNENLLGLDPTVDSTEDKKILDLQDKEREEKYGDIIALLNTTKDTETEKFAKSLYNATGQNSKPEEVAKIAKENLQKLIEKGNYTESSFNTNIGTTKADTITYLKKFFKTLTLTQTDLDQIQNAVSNTDKINKIILLKEIKKIDNAEQFLLTLSYPADSVTYFKDLANSLVYLKNTLKQILKSEHDPIMSLTALTLLETAFIDISTQYEKIFN